ncbi:MAG: DUF3263 domain-containing protein [Acidimicrobiales bacterium]|nr:DUF3263 domain-containing protein [Acidimicrobiales bacterium]
MLDSDLASWQAALVPLSDQQQAILDLERAWWTEAGSKRDAIRDRLGLSPGRYYTLLAPLLDSEDAAAYDPLLVRRLRRERERRRRARFEARSAEGPPGR